MLFIIHVYLIMCLYGLVNKLVATQLLKDDSLKANRRQTSVSLLSLMNPMLYLLSTNVLMLALFFNTLEKSRMGTRLLVWRKWACNQPVSCPCGIGVFTRRLELSFRCLLSKVMSFILSMLYIKHCLLILPLFVAICEI